MTEEILVLSLTWLKLNSRSRYISISLGLLNAFFVSFSSNVLVRVQQLQYVF